MLGIARWCLASAACITIGLALHQGIGAERDAQPTIVTRTLHSKTYIPAANSSAECSKQDSSKNRKTFDTEQSTQPSTSFGSNAPSWREAEICLNVDKSLQRSPDAVRALNAALAAWTSAADELPRISLNLTDATSQSPNPDQERADHRISFAPWGDTRSNGALAVTVLTIDEDKNSILDADIVINGLYRFTEFDDDCCSSTAPEYDLQSVLTHEIGHWFGLPEDPCNPDATMYMYTLPNETKKRDLTQDDVIAAQVAYWQADNPSGEVGCSFVSRESSSAAFGLSWALAAVLFARARLSKRGLGKGTSAS